jgi:hypothetical protein
LGGFVSGIIRQTISHDEKRATYFPSILRWQHEKRKQFRFFVNSNLWKKYSREKEEALHNQMIKNRIDRLVERKLIFF